MLCVSLRLVNVVPKPKSKQLSYNFNVLFLGYLE